MGLAGNLASAQRGLETSVSPAPSPLEAALRAAEVRADRLAAELGQLKESLRTEVSKAREQARREAAAEFAANDLDRSQMLAEALHGARDDFREAIAAGAEEIAIELARTCIEKFVALSGDEPHWLTRVVAAQLSKLEEQTVTALHVPPGTVGEDAETVLRSQLPPGATLVPDPRLKPGTARIALKVGEIFVDPRAGAAQLLNLLDEGL